MNPSVAWSTNDNFASTETGTGTISESCLAPFRTYRGVFGHDSRAPLFNAFVRSEPPRITMSHISQKLKSFQSFGYILADSIGLP